MNTLPPLSLLDNALSAEGATPLHARVQTALRAAIDEYFEDGQSFWTELALTQHLKVSRFTVRQALSELAREGLLLQESTKTRIVSKSEAEVGIFIPTHNDDFGSEMLAALEHVCFEERRYTLRPFFTRELKSALASFERLSLSPRKIRLLLFENARQNLQLHEALQARGYRTLTLDSRVPGFTGAYLGTDTQAVVQLGLRHLTNLGHRRILLLVCGHEPSLEESVQTKITTFKAFLQQQGIEEGRVHCQPARAETDTFNLAYGEMEHIWAEQPRPTAIFTVNDPSAWGVLKWLGERGIKVPGEVSVLGFEGTRPSRYMQPALTTVSHPVQALARRAIEMLWEDNEAQELLPPHLEMRESTGPCPS